MLTFNIFKNLALLVFTFCLLQSVVGQSANNEKMPFGNNSEKGKYASIRGIKMYYEVYGAGRPMLLIHGNGRLIQDFQHQIPYLARNYKVIAVDSGAQEKSADMGDTLSYEMMADDFNAGLTQLHEDSCDVIGWSDGGINGLLPAMCHPEKARKLAITGTNLWPVCTKRKVLKILCPTHFCEGAPSSHMIT